MKKIIIADNERIILYSLFAFYSFLTTAFVMIAVWSYMPWAYIEDIPNEWCKPWDIELKRASGEFFIEVVFILTPLVFILAKNWLCEKNCN